MKTSSIGIFCIESFRATCMGAAIQIFLQEEGRGGGGKNPILEVK